MFRCGSSNTGNLRLITTYQYHGIQYGAILLCCDALNSKDLHARLWDIETIAIVQSISIPSPMYVICWEGRLVYLTKVRLASCLSPNGNHISTAKNSGYDLYSLNTGIVLHVAEALCLESASWWPRCHTIMIPNTYSMCCASVWHRQHAWSILVYTSVPYICFCWAPHSLRDALASFIPS